jgi:hypothetical protein
LPAELATWGWHETSFFEGNYDFENGENDISMALKALGLSTLPAHMGGDNVGHSIEHFDATIEDEDGDIVDDYLQTYKVNGKEYHVRHRSPPL